MENSHFISQERHDKKAKDLHVFGNEAQLCGRMWATEECDFKAQCA